MNTKEYTFKNLFGSSFKFEEEDINLNKIEIPIIQRDYAQGRTNENVNRIREKFLDALFHSLTNNTHIVLDFIYGDVSKEGVLTPLDGQQRLTTLFLLHWYIAKKENLAEGEYEFLNNFTYATRFSSRDFCKELIKYSPDFNKDNLSETIKDQYWYPYEWKNDPTIQSMLVMIDAIHKKFRNSQGLWKSLVTNKNITFYFLPLSKMGLSDDLYIKMNSRGKPLTLFEHFKAEFEEIIKEYSENKSTELNHKFDIDWTDMLFPYRGDNNIIDDEFMRYFKFISHIISYQSGIELENDEFILAKKLYSRDNTNAEQNLNILINSFDIWHDLAKIDGFFTKFFSADNYEPNKVKLYQADKNIFKECLDNYGEYSGRIRKFPLNKILLLFSIITYLQNKINISEDEFRRRIRIIRNLIWNSQDEIRDERMKTLLSECENIITQGEIPISEKGDLGFNVRQKKEELEKIEWLEANPQMKEELFQLEDHKLLKGCIAIVGLEKSENFKKFRLLFDNCSKDLINRVLLSIGDYSQLISWRYQFGAKNNESVWFDLFHPSKQRQGFEKTKNLLNQLLSTLNEDTINNNYLEDVVNNYLNNITTTKNWRYYFTKYSSMRDGNFGMYYWNNRDEKPYEIIMMNTEKRLVGKNWNIYLYTLYDYLKDLIEKLSIGEYANKEDKFLKVDNGNIVIDCLNDKYLVFKNGEQKEPEEYKIQQENGIDIEDRIEKGKQIVNDLFNEFKPDK